MIIVYLLSIKQQLFPKRVQFSEVYTKPELLWLDLILHNALQRQAPGRPDAAGACPPWGQVTGR